jgi:pyruvate dehydrogenase phosphatase
MTDRMWIADIAGAFKNGYAQVARTGACALTVFLRDGVIWTANAGDCRAVLGSKDEGTGRMQALALSKDHNCKFQDEKDKLMEEHPHEENIVKCKSEDSCYVKGCLQPTRALGDLYLKYAEFNGPSSTERFRGKW